MNVLDPGHMYLLDRLDSPKGIQTVLSFVKREGPKYPGNVGSHEGTTMQEVLRAVIDRARYVQNQQPCEETAQVIDRLEQAVYTLEVRAARLHSRPVLFSVKDAVDGRGACSRCGHVGCLGHD